MPILDTRVYEVQLANGVIEEYTANEIASSMLSQVDEEGYHFNLLKGIIDHRKTNDVESNCEPDEHSHLKKNTKGWEFLYKWTNG